MIYGKIGRYEIKDNNQPLIMTVINISPESFFKGSIKNTDNLSENIHKAINEGADIIDIGAASTAPPEYGTPPITREEELRRIKNALQEILEINTEFSIDTMHSEVAEYALKKGVRIINDVSGLKNDTNMAKVIADYDAYIIIMACKNAPGDVGKIYEIKTELRKSIDIAIKAGIDPEKIIIDPGIGFGKPYEQDLEIIQKLQQFRTINKPILVGVSRKSFIGKVLENVPPEKRLFGSLSATAIAVYNGAHIIRTHDTKETYDVVRIAYSIKPKIQYMEDIELLTWLHEPADAEEVMIDIGVQPEGAKIMKNKMRVLPILLRNVQTPAATIIKEEMLALGGDAATHSGTVDCFVKTADILILGTDIHIKRLIKKLSKMPYFNLDRISTKLRTLIKQVENYE